ncbi:hypothetical protein [Roseicella aerolata]|uniref:Uncharacterized protein n=1 Tax=Roseicella aerolata TaxID=2883479 RepID=A0A9X1IIK2_9PROT|nr:hypothetical protein [Roseicella aerolata]MCB4824038.1 hypothetical protein [Roseicella aerolata]
MGDPAMAACPRSALPHGAAWGVAAILGWNAPLRPVTNPRGMAVPHHLDMPRSGIGSVGEVMGGCAATAAPASRACISAGGTRPSPC